MSNLYKLFADSDEIQSNFIISPKWWTYGLLLILWSQCAYAQQVEWTFSENEQTYIRTVDTRLNNDIVFSGYDWSTQSHFIRIITQDGNEVSYTPIDVTVFTNSYLQLYSLLNDDIIVYDDGGNFAIFDATSLELKANMAIDFGTYDEPRNIRVQKYRDDLYLISGSVSVSGNRESMIAIHNPTDNSTVGLQILDIDVYGSSLLASFDDAGNTLITYKADDGWWTIMYDIAFEEQWTVFDNRELLTNFGAQLTNDQYVQWGTIQESVFPYKTRGFISAYSRIDQSLIWTREVSPEGDETFSAIRDVQINEHNEIMFAGEIGYATIYPVTDIQFGMLDANGDVVWRDRERLSMQGDWVSEMLITENSELIIGGRYDFSDIEYGLGFVMKVSSNNSSTIDVGHGLDLELRPNPVSNMLYIDIGDFHSPVQIQISNIQGKIMQTFNLLQGQSSLEVDVYDFPIGHYLLQAKTKDQLLCVERISIMR